MLVGQKLWFVPGYNHGRPCELTVTKVGRKWATTDHRSRVDMETLYVDGAGFSSPGRCYLSREIYEHSKNLDDLWSELFKRLRNHGHTRPDSVSEWSIREAARLLRIELPNSERNREP